MLFYIIRFLIASYIHAGDEKETELIGYEQKKSIIFVKNPFINLKNLEFKYLKNSLTNNQLITNKTSSNSNILKEDYIITLQYQNNDEPNEKY